MSVEVDDVDSAYAAMQESGAEIVHPLQEEEWGVRRFFVHDPNGCVVNVLSHRRDLPAPPAAAPGICAPRPGCCRRRCH